ncbi:MAG TPA: hypothetical protein VMK42_16475 [Anaeromyxobacteraceae bacterium]|nr:hypothetical protein [Anaeromyxobacteraceae bacterium]
MDGVDVEEVRSEIDALSRKLAEERFRHVAGIEAEPALAAAFRAHGRAAHKDTVAALRGQGEAELARAVAALRAERAAAGEEEAWRAAESAASGECPGGRLPLGAADLRASAEADRARRLAFERGAAEAARSAAPRREAAAEARARARAEMGLVPPWEAVVEGDELLNASEDAYREALSWLASRQALPAPPSGELGRADLRHLLGLRAYDGLFRPQLLAAELRRAFLGLGLDPEPVRVDAEERPAKWPGAHAFEGRVSFRRQGGVADWLGLFAAVGAAVAARASPPSRRARHFPAALGALASSLLLAPRFLERALGVERRHLPDVVRGVALRRLFELRVRAAALRVAAESERGLTGAAWRRAHREALGAAALATWPDGLAARDSDADLLFTSLAGAAWGEKLRRELVERYDEDFFLNPRTPGALSGLLAAGSPGPETEKPPIALASRALAKAIEGGS